MSDCQQWCSIILLQDQVQNRKDINLIKINNCYGDDIMRLTIEMQIFEVYCCVVVLVVLTNDKGRIQKHRLVACFS